MFHLTLPPLTRLTLGETSRRFGCSHRALRYYEELGLITTSRNRHKGRCYDATALQRLEWICRLRRAGIPITTIRQVLAASDTEAFTLAVTALETREIQLEAELAEVRQTLGRLGGAVVDRPARLRAG